MTTTGKLRIENKVIWLYRGVNMNQDKQPCPD